MKTKQNYDEMEQKCYRNKSENSSKLQGLPVQYHNGLENLLSAHNECQPIQYPSKYHRKEDGLIHSAYKVEQNNILCCVQSCVLVQNARACKASIQKS